jgi:hypothetical protein
MTYSHVRSCVRTHTRARAHANTPVTVCSARSALTDQRLMTPSADAEYNCVRVTRVFAHTRNNVTHSVTTSNQCPDGQFVALQASSQHAAQRPQHTCNTCTHRYSCVGSAVARRIEPDDDSPCAAAVRAFSLGADDDVALVAALGVAVCAAAAAAVALAVAALTAVDAVVGSSVTGTTGMRHSENGIDTFCTPHLSKHVCWRHASPRTIPTNASESILTAHTLTHPIGICERCDGVFRSVQGLLQFEQLRTHHKHARDALLAYTGSPTRFDRRQARRVNCRRSAQMQRHR